MASDFLSVPSAEPDQPDHDDGKAHSHADNVPRLWSGREREPDHTADQRSPRQASRSGWSGSAENLGRKLVRVRAHHQASGRGSSYERPDSLGLRPRGPGGQRPQAEAHLRQSRRKTDEVDAENLARLARLDPKLEASPAALRLYGVLRSSHRTSEGVITQASRDPSGKRVTKRVAVFAPNLPVWAWARPRGP